MTSLGELMAPEPTIGGLTADQLIDHVQQRVFAAGMATASLNAIHLTEGQRALFRQAATMGATEMYRTLVALGKDLLDQPRPGVTHEHLVQHEGQGPCEDPYCTRRRLCTCPDIDVTEFGQEPGSHTVKGLAPDCPIHGNG